jgi:hypothetical protein
MIDPIHQSKTRKVFVVDSEFHCHAKVFIVQNEAEADMNIEFVENLSDADLKVLIVNFEVLSNFKVFVKW